MYSVVLLTALTTGGSAPTFFHPPVVSGVLPPSPYWSAYGPPINGTALAGNGFGTCYGCCGGGGCIGGVGILQNGAPPYGGAQPWLPQSPVPASQAPERLQVPPQNKLPGTRIETGPAPFARLVVDLPAGARLFVNDQPTQTTTTGARVFQTPELEPGQRYAYDLRAVIEVDGKPLEQRKRIVFRSGDEIQARFDDPRPLVRAGKP